MHTTDKTQNMSVFGVNAMIYGHVHLSPSSIGQAEFVVKARVSIVILFRFNKVRIKGKKLVEGKMYPVHTAAGSVEPPNEEVKSMTKWVKLITKKT